jgi:hypothetical protein
MAKLLLSSGKGGKARSKAEVEQELPPLYFTNKKIFVIILLEKKKILFKKCVCLSK